MKINLYYQAGASDKVYRIEIAPVGSKYVVNFAFGRRGTNLQTGTKTPQPVDLGTATNIYNKVVAEKMAKGYREVGAGGSHPKPVIASVKQEVKAAPPAPKTGGRSDKSEASEASDYGFHNLEL